MSTDRLRLALAATQARLVAARGACVAASDAADALASAIDDTAPDYLAALRAIPSPEVTHAAEHRELARMCRLQRKILRALDRSSADAWEAQGWQRPDSLTDTALLHIFGV